MSTRDFFLAAYDVADPRRLAAALELIKGHATGGQKSVYECFLTPAEAGHLLQDIALVLDEGQDSFLLIALDPRSRVHTLGRAQPPVDPEHFYIG
jgi:CRISPR-associated protein Cas2